MGKWREEKYMKRWELQLPFFSLFVSSNAGKMTRGDFSTLLLISRVRTMTLSSEDPQAFRDKRRLSLHAELLYILFLICSFFLPRAKSWRCINNAVRSAIGCSRVRPLFCFFCFSYCSSFRDTHSKLKSQKRNCVYFPKEVKHLATNAQMTNKEMEPFRFSFMCKRRRFVKIAATEKLTAKSMNYRMELRIMHSTSFFTFTEKIALRWC